MHVEARGDSRSRETAGKHFQPKACVSRSPVKGRRQGKIVDGSVEARPCPIPMDKPSIRP